jgi:uncharacterized protein
VAAFGAFVDIGVHQDGLVHVSQLADRFVKDPRDVVKAGQVVTVRVLDVDLKRKRISLSMRRDTDAGAPTSAANRTDGPVGKQSQRRPERREPPRGALGDALAEALRKR